MERKETMQKEKDKRQTMITHFRRMVNTHESMAEAALIAEVPGEERDRRHQYERGYADASRAAIRYVDRLFGRKT